MAEPQPQIVITAIRDPDSEGFIASTLFSQGWSINFRALDSESLLSFLKDTESSQWVLLISTDCEGLTPEIILKLRKVLRQVILFQASTEDHSEYHDAIVLPDSSLSLIALMRGTLRSPLIRPHSVTTVVRRAKVIAIASSSGRVGCTSFAINLASEIAAKNRKTLLIDAHAYAPAIAALLGQRGLQQSSEARQIAQALWAQEITRTEISEGIESLDCHVSDYDFIIIDLGTLRDLASSLSGRRWSSEALIWVSTCADELILLSVTDILGIERLKSLTNELSRNSIKPAISFLQVQGQFDKRSSTNSDAFIKLVTPLRPRRVLLLPHDARSLHAAEIEQMTLLESNEKSLLRKAIARIAGEVIS
jgi:MinD-like ATPase involved in chromosome partitioning or flagellar assembly